MLPLLKGNIPNPLIEMYMNHYMIDIDLPEYLDDDFLQLVPEQRAHINMLMNEGVITSYSLAEDRSKLWTTLIAANEKEVGEILSAFPLISYLVYSVHMLAFHNTTQYTMPPISLN